MQFEAITFEWVTCPTDIAAGWTIMLKPGGPDNITNNWILTFIVFPTMWFGISLTYCDRANLLYN
ncbi:MAG: hypothetical protein K8R25_01460 [Methanosarcinales archaeon]|nr:hypothetical protein [Methanosarcinales archaeon]